MFQYVIAQHVYNKAYVIDVSKEQWRVYPGKKPGIMTYHH